MNRHKARVLFIYTFLFVFIWMTPVSFAQGPGFDDDVEDTPFDGGITLVIAAAGYGIKKLRTGKKE